MKKTVLVIAMVLATLSSVNAIENDFEPIYSDFEKSFVADGHCDFDAMEKNGIDLEKETLILFENN